MQDREGKEHTLEPDGVPGDLKSCAGISGVQYTHILDSCQVFNHSFYFRCLRGLPLVWFSSPPSHLSSTHFLVTFYPHFNPHYVIASETMFAEFQKEEETGQPSPYPEAVLVMDIFGSNFVATFNIYHQKL